MAVHVGGILRGKAIHGSHHMLPLHADIPVGARSTGLLAQTGILWSKLTICHGRSGGSAQLGRPDMPNQAARAEHEHMLLFRKAAEIADQHCPRAGPAFINQLAEELCRSRATAAVDTFDHAASLAAHTAPGVADQLVGDPAALSNGLDPGLQRLQRTALTRAMVKGS